MSNAEALKKIAASLHTILVCELTVAEKKIAEILVEAGYGKYVSGGERKTFKATK